jgi:hypothetical protein
VADVREGNDVQNVGVSTTRRFTPCGRFFELTEAISCSSWGFTSELGFLLRAGVMSQRLGQHRERHSRPTTPPSDRQADPPAMLRLHSAGR